HWRTPPLLEEQTTLELGLGAAVHAIPNFMPS
ncbi:unnamed protein product, partial [marine sediment metagenome]